MKTKETLFALSLIVVSAIMVIILMAGCNPEHYHPVTEERPVAGFVGIALDGVGKTKVYVGGNAHAVSVTADMDIADRVTVGVDTGSGILRVGASRGTDIGDGGMSAFNKWPIGVEARLADLRYVAIGKTGAGDIRVTADAAAVSELLVFHEGDGDIDLRGYKVSSVTVVHSGKGRVRLGAVDTLYIDSTALHSSFGTIQYAGDRAVIRWFRKWEPQTISPPPIPPCDKEDDRYCEDPGLPNGDQLKLTNASAGRPPGGTNAATSGWIENERVGDSVANKVEPYYMEIVPVYD